MLENSEKSIKEWFVEQQKSDGIHAEIIPFQESKSWSINNDGTISNKNKTYYEAVIVKYNKKEEKEEFENLMLRSLSKNRTNERQIHGVILLAEYQGKFLVQAKAEGGNITPGRVVLTTTIQSSHENIAKYPIAYKELIKENTQFILAAPQDAGMFYGKHNEYRYVKLKNKPLIDNQRFRLATLKEISELQSQDLVGDHLTQMLGHIYLSESTGLESNLLGGNKMKWKDQNVFITGADGFIGGWIAKVLADKGAHVVALCRDERKTSAINLHHLKDKVTIVKGDLTDFKLMKRILNEYSINYCFHLAAQAIVGIANRSPLSTFETNIKGTWRLLEAIRELNSKNFKGIVVASTDKAYGTHEKLPYTEESELRGIYPYDASKVCVDIISRCYATMYNLPVAVTRKANIYGGADPNMSRIIPDTVCCLIQDKELLIRSDGTPERDFMYVEDAVEGYLTLAENIQRADVNGQAFNFSSGKAISVLKLVNTIIKVYGKELSPRILGEAKGEIDRQYLANEKAKRILNWEPKHDLEEGLRKTIEWYKEYYKSD